MRRCRRLLQFQGFPGGGRTPGGIPAPPPGFTDALRNSRQPSSGGGGDGGGGGMPDVFGARMAEIQSMMQSMMTPEVRAQMQQQMQSQWRDLSTRASSDGGPSVGMMAFGFGENEKGKKVARAATVVRDASGAVKKEFVEHQLEPDDVQLPRETVENYDTSGAIEVELEEDRKKLENVVEIEVETTDVGKK